jgi:hypothetical protein
VPGQAGLLLAAFSVERFPVSHACP